MWPLVIDNRPEIDVFNVMVVRRPQILTFVTRSKGNSVLMESIHGTLQESTGRLQERTYFALLTGILNLRNRKTWIECVRSSVATGIRLTSDIPPSGDSKRRVIKLLPCFRREKSEGTTRKRTRSV